MPHSRRVVLAQLAATGLMAACRPADPKEGLPEDSAAPVDTGPTDTGPLDTGPVDTGPVDTGPAEEPGFPDALRGECRVEAELPEECRRTPPASEGPFYRETIPYRENFNVRGQEGLHIVVTGRVMAEDGCAPLPGAEVVVWHATPDEIYDNTEDHHCTGRVVCDDQGFYCFYTLRPPPYPNGDNTGFLPAHFHLHILWEGKIVFTTQLYFQGDPYLEGFTPQELIKTEVEVEPGVVAIEHDFFLSPEALA